MMLKFILLAYMVQSAIAAPQLLTFRDGKFGVNFGGYHAEAGLGGLLTGDSAHGGLSASAGTPYGQKAAAGLGGSAGGNAAGLLYAGAEANPHTGASAILGGDTSKGGYGGSVAYADGKVVSNTKVLPNALNNQVDTVTSAPSNVKSSGESGETYIQKVRPPKKYLIKPSYAAQVAASANANANSNANVNTNSNAGVNIAHSKHLSKRVENQNFGYSAPSPIPDMNLNIGPDVVTSALQIPIGILRSLQETLGNLGASKQASVSLNH